MYEDKVNFDGLWIEVALGAWIDHYVSEKSLPVGITTVPNTPHVYQFQIDKRTTPLTIVQKMKIPQEELGVMLFLGHRVFLDSPLFQLVQTAQDSSETASPRLWLYPMVIGG